LEIVSPQLENISVGIWPWGIFPNVGGTIFNNHLSANHFLSCFTSLLSFVLATASEDNFALREEVAGEGAVVSSAAAGQSKFICGLFLAVFLF